MNKQLSGTGLDSTPTVEVCVEGVGQRRTRLGERSHHVVLERGDRPASPSSARSGSSSAACTGRGAPRHPATASMPAIASTADACADARVGVVGPITTGSSEKLRISSERNVIASMLPCSSPLTTITSRSPCTTASAARPCCCAIECTVVTTDTPSFGGGVPMITVAGAVASQFSVAARESMSEPVSPRTTASTTSASRRVSQAPRDSAALA
ncbi:hypothetical protein GQ85_04215 [Rhodococcus rhodochrous]|nr:hypothetical protein GQ85_04215 [Rhodococcus rhodochrous]